ncbi:MAG: hypothetical protein IMY88_04115 [Chloroflexi bacterium]|nr:hypothetical protein [Chloroflexota bacterium]
MHILKTILNWGWCPILITVLAVVCCIYEWPIGALVPILIIILVIGLTMAVIGAKEKELEHVSLQLRQLAGYFNRRFAGASSLSIFTIIDSLFNIDNPKLWDWARACDMSQRIFNTWCDSFMKRVESDIRTRRFDVYLRTYLNELWLANNHYYDFVEQFYEIAEKVEIPQETIDQYNKFVMEYNAFVQDFRDSISELKKIAKTEIEPPSVNFAKELSEVK